MLKVNNKGAIVKLAKNSFKSNRLRNIFAIIAIMLTAVLFTGLFTIVSSMIDSMEESTMRQVGTKSHAGFKYLSMEQYEKLKTHPSIKKMGYTSVLGIGENSELRKRVTEIRYTDSEFEAEQSFALPTEGRLPKSDNEIATDTLVLERLGIPAKLGEKVTLEYTVDDIKYKDTFDLVGIWQGDKMNMASMAWLNKSFVESRLANHIPLYGVEGINTINPSFNFSNSRNIEEKIIKVIEDSGYSVEDIAYGVNWAYVGNVNYDAGTILGFVGVILIIVFCGYLIISNVFLISITKDIRFYGMLKTIGTTAKQLKYLIRRQAILLSGIGVPLGLVCGYFVGRKVVPVVLGVLNTNVIKIALNPMIFIIAALFSIITVFISISKPSKIAAKISPIEAMRSSEGPSKKSKKNVKTRKSTKGSNVYQMAISNLGRNKKKTALVTISLSLGLIILNSAYTLANGFDVEKYLENSINSDFAIGDISNFNVHIDYVDQDTLSPEFYNSLKSKTGIEELSNIYFTENQGPKDIRMDRVIEEAPKVFPNITEDEISRMKYQNKLDDLLFHTYGLDDNVFDKLELLDGEIDLNKMKTGDYIIVGTFDEEGLLNYYNIGDKVKLSQKDKSIKEYEVMAIALLPYPMQVKHSHPLTPSVFLPSENFIEDIEEKSPMLLALDVEDSKEKEFEIFLEEFEEQNDSFAFNSRARLIAECEGFQESYRTVGLVVSILIAFIGIMNFVNTTITSIISRKVEIAMLQSIGMTNKQMKTMLALEGLCYTALTAIFVLSIGSVVGYTLLNALMGGSYFTINVTVIPSLICLPILAIISAAVPLVSQKVLTKNSIVERLRESE